MGHQDIVDEFNRKDEELGLFIRENFVSEHYDPDVVVKKIESLVPFEYMAIIKKHQE